MTLEKEIEQIIIKNVDSVNLLVYWRDTYAKDCYYFIEDGRWSFRGYCSHDDNFRKHCFYWLCPFAKNLKEKIYEEVKKEVLNQIAL